LPTGLGEELVEAQQAHHPQSQPWPAELAAALHADPLDVDLDAFCLDVVEELSLAISRVLCRLFHSFADDLIRLGK